MMLRSLSARALAPAALTLLTLVGCSQGDRPPIGEVTGVIKLDDQPLAKAIVTFSPVGGGRPSQAMTDADGKYELVYIGTTNGAKVGQHKVSLTTSYDGEENGKTVHFPEQIPPKYNGDKTELTADVKPGANVFDFDLKGRLTPKKRSGS